jgi:hypothetical protein
MARNFRKPTVSMRGVVIDMDAMRAANEDSRAVGNAKMNARGDIVGVNGQIEVRREQIAREYHNRNPQAAKQVSLKPAIPDVFETPEQAIARLTGLADTVETETDMPAGIVPKKGRKLVDDAQD